MKTFEIDGNSWHYRLAFNFGGFDPYTSAGHNMCAYIRSVLLGIALLSVTTFLAGYLTISFLFYLGAGWIWITTGYFVMIPWMLGGAAMAIIITILLAFAAFSVASYFMRLAFAKLKSKTIQPVVQEPGFITLAWRSFKDKTCSKIVIK